MQGNLSPNWISISIAPLVKKNFPPVCLYRTASHVLCFLLLFCFRPSCCSLCSCFPCSSSLCFYPVGVFCSPPPLADEAQLPSVYRQSTHYTSPPWTSPQCLRVSCRFNDLPIHSCYFRISRDQFLFMFLIVSFLCLRSGYAVCLSQPRLCLALGSSCDFWFMLVCSASVSGLSVCCSFVGVFLESRAQSPFPLLVVLCALLSVSSLTISVGLLFFSK